MKIVVPYTNPEAFQFKSVRVALEQDDYKADLRLVEGNEGYYNLLSEYFSNGNPFVVVEHDIIPWPGAIKQISDCSEPWCTFSYRCAAGWLTWGLGCVKFEPRRLPNLMDFGCKMWNTLDRSILMAGKRNQISPHVHGPHVTNLNPVIWINPQRCEMRNGQFLTIEESKLI